MSGYGRYALSYHGKGELETHVRFERAEKTVRRSGVSCVFDYFITTRRTKRKPTSLLQSEIGVDCLKSETSEYAICK